jgi:hypothetical protein
LLLVTILPAYPDLLTPCRFHFGTPYDVASSNSSIMAQVDYLTMWAGSGESFNMSTFFTTCKNNKKTPVLIAYIIAFTARRDVGLKDCNVGTPNLCQDGANYIRNNRARILAQYGKYARGANTAFNNTDTMVWCMEPDYVQYANADQNGGGLTQQECGNLMKEIIDTIRAGCPRSKFSMDISPWKDTTWHAAWYARFRMSDFSYLNTSGGTSRADQTFINDTWSTRLPTWAWVTRKYHIPTIADAGYGVGGAGTGYDTRWDNVTNLRARINDGVIAVAQYQPVATWGDTISNRRALLPTPASCNDATSTGASVKTGMSPTMHHPGNISAWPNPFSRRVTLSFSGAADQFSIFDMQGKKIADLTGSIRGNSLRWDARACAKGMYVVRVTGPAGSLQKQLFLTQ